MSGNLRLSSSASGTRNLFDNSLDFSSFGGSPGASGATNIAAVASFNTAYAALTGRTQLYVPPGVYTGSTAFNFANTVGVAGSQLVISAYGVTFTAPSNGSLNGWAISAGVGTDGTKEARIVTVSAGASTVSLVTAGQTSRFSVGQWCLVSSIDMQGYGDPPNLGIFEYKKILSIGAGTLTFTESLLYSYKDTYPNYSTGRGGPATVYPMQGFWDQDVEFKGARFTDNGNLVYGKTRVAQFTDCTFDTYGPCPTVNAMCQIRRCSATVFGAIEIDKCVQRLEITDSSLKAVEFQSASVNELYVNNLTSTNRWKGGAGRSNTFINHVVSAGGGGGFDFGEMNYGAMGPTYMENCSSPVGGWFSANIFPFADYIEEGGGVLSYAGGPNPASNTTGYWAVPGNNCVLLDASNGFARSFQVSDVTQSGGRTYVTTNLPFPVPSTINGKSSPWRIANHPCADLTMVTCTGNSLYTTQSALPAHSPFQSWTL